MVKKAIIAAAGFGTRFLPVTKAYPKELLPVLDKPVIQYLVEEILAAGIKEIAIVHRHGNPAIKRYFTPDPKLTKFLADHDKSEFLSSLDKIQKKVSQFHFFPQPNRLPYGTGTPVLTAKSFIGHDPFVYLYGDDLILEPQPGQFLASLIQTFEKYHASAVFGCQEVPWKDVARYGSIRYKKGSKIPNQIETVEEGLPPEKAPSNFVQFGRFVVSSQVINLLKSQPLSTKKELFFTDAMKTMAHANVVIAKPIKEGKWLTTGDPNRWLQTNLEFHQFFKENNRNGS